MLRNTMLVLEIWNPVKSRKTKSADVPTEDYRVDMDGHCFGIFKMLLHEGL